MFEVLVHIMGSFPHINKTAFCARFKDDRIILYNGTVEELEDFYHIGNNTHRHLKFTYEISAESITFLDTLIFKGRRFLSSGILDL